MSAMGTNGTTEVAIHVNNAHRKVECRPGWTLLELLRDGLLLTGTKRGCDDGTCGTCTVMVNGAMVRACRVPLRRAAGQEVLTIEGLGAPGQLQPLQKAFIEADAVQCGFCTPGMIMAAKALLDRNPAPTRQQIVRALGSNLCRCTGYTSILEAISRVVASRKGVLPQEPPAPATSHQRADALDKVLGVAKYAADLTMPSMLHAAVLRSPHPHAEILTIDDTEARALPGVVEVVTARDVPGLNRFGRSIKDQPVLAEGRVRQIGDAVAAVAAVSPEVASAAISLIRVAYRPLPAMLDPTEALKAHALQLHDSGNLLAEKDVRWGDVDEGLRQADLIVEETYTTPWCEHAYLEPEAALAYLDGDGRLVVYTATQHSHLHRAAVAETMGLSPEQVRIVPTVVGGAFGGKTDISCQCIVALLALKTRRPVKIVYSRAESFVSTTKRHPFSIRCQTGVTSSGLLTALKVEMVADTGAYASAGPHLMVRVAVSIVGPYQFPNAALHGRVVYTNNPLAGAMRGFGAPQAAFAIESQMDIMAARLGIDPVQFRYMNRRRSTEATPPELEQEAAYQQTLEAIRPFYQEAVRARQASAKSSGRWRRGVGVASMRYGIGTSDDIQKPGRVSLELATDGRVRLFTGAMDMGQGSDTALALIVAKELALPLESVLMVTGDTDITPDAGSSTGSRLVYFVGNAAKEAGVALKEAILSTAAGLLKIPSEELELRDGLVARRGDGSSSGSALSLAQVALARLSAGLPLRIEGVFDPTPLLHDPRTRGRTSYPVHVSATHLAEVEVDSERGIVRVLRVVAAHDVGQAVYPQGVRSQIEGAVVMGIGFALKEEFHPGETLGFKEYRIPTTRDAPKVVSLLVEMVDPSASLGAKGVAECATVAVAPAITNAIADALGVRVHDLPATPARLLSLMGQTRSSS